MAIAYCMREKKNRRMINQKEVTLSNGHDAIKGTCPQCGATLIKVVD